MENWQRLGWENSGRKEGNLAEEKGEMTEEKMGTSRWKGGKRAEGKVSVEEGWQNTRRKGGNLAEEKGENGRRKDVNLAEGRV